MKKIIFTLIFFECSFFYGFADWSGIGVIGYLNYGISEESGNKYHTLCQDILIPGEHDGFHIPTMGVKINLGENNNLFFLGYRYSLGLFSLTIGKWI